MGTAGPGACNGVGVKADGRRSLAALTLQGLALVALSLSLLGAAWLDPRSRPRVLVLADRSESVPRTLADQALADVARATVAAGGEAPQVLEFAGRPGVPGAPGLGAAAGLVPSATDLEAALDAALAAHARSAFDRIVVVSDGLETQGDAARAMRAVRDAGLPLQWLAVGSPLPPVRVAEVLAPDRVRVGQRIAISVRLAGRSDPPLRVRASARSPAGEMLASGIAAAGADPVTIGLDARRAGALIVDVALEDPASGRTLDALPDAAVVDVAPPAALLYAQGDAGPLADSLMRGGWALNVVPAARLDAQADALDGYQAVVLDDVAIADAGPRFWAALVAAVQQRGLGLLVLGGERSFARGGYRGSVLESVLPVLSEPPALDQPASVLFAVDKSGSMGEGSGGVDRFQLAQRAVLETARGLGGGDALGLLVFDVAPRLLLPLGPAPAGAAALERAWQATPNGGTRLAPALDAAIAELERADTTRRILVVVTDGFVEDAPLAGLRARLERSRIETIWLAVGPDADAGALERLVGPASGLVLRVDQAAELPRLMRTALERRRARVERGTIAVRQRQPLPFASGSGPDRPDWPDIAAYVATRPQPGAVVVLQSERGDPLLAHRRAGHGRVVAVTSGLGPWTPAWLRWREWPQLAGGLADWAAGSPPGGAAALTVTDQPGGMTIQAELAGTGAATGRPAVAAVDLTVDTPTLPQQPVSAALAAPGRWQATLPDAGPGLYSFVWSTPFGTLRQLHLRRPRAEHAAWGTSPALDAWRSAGLLSDWAPGSPARAGDGGRGIRPPDRSWMVLALLLFLAGVLLDRTRPSGRGLRDALRRWRTRA